MDSVPPYPLKPRLDQRVGADSLWASTGGSRGKRSVLRRLRQMPLTEIAYRGWQEASKWLERVSPERYETDPEALLRAHARELASPDAALRWIRERAPLRFFAGIAATDTATALRARLPGERQDVLAAADALLEGRFSLLGHRMLWFGDPIDWHFDPVWLRRAPFEHWSQIDSLDPQLVGDSKIVWELNRHQWLVRIAQGWALTGDERYAAACIHNIDSWIEANPSGIGINWASSLEVAYRLMSWCWTILLIRESRQVSGDWTMKLLANIWLHANHIRRYLSYYFSPNTHLTGEALGLFYAGILFPEFREASKWRDLGTRILVSESGSQIAADGVHFELSTCYQRYTIETYLHFMLLASRNGVAVPPELRERVERMVDFLLAVRGPDGSIPAIGDDDGGALLPLTQRSPGDARGIFAVAAAIFQRPDFAWAAGGAAPEPFWLMGPNGQQAFDSIVAEPPTGAGCRVFPSGGYAVMRSGWDTDAHQLIADIGPLGCPVSSGHGHADLLSIQCSAFGEPFLVDAGTYCYTAEAQWRDYFRSTAAHSALMVDGRSQAEPDGPFAWHQRPRARLRKWHSDATHDVIDAEHDAFLNLADPVTYRRRIIFVKPHFWLVVDELNGTSSHQIDLTFQFAPLQVTLASQTWARAESPNGRVLWLSGFQSSPVQMSLKCGELAPIRGWISSDYGQRQPAPMLTYSSTGMLPWRGLTLLFPDAHASSLPPVVHPIYDDTGSPVGLTLERPRTTVWFEDQAVSLT